MVRTILKAALVVQFLSVIAEVAGQSPCPNYFRYVRDEQTNEIMGIIEMPSPPRGIALHLSVGMSIAVALPTKYVGRLELAQSREESVRAVQQGGPLRYRIHFPLRHPTPTLTGLWFNNKQVCAGPRAMGPVVTSIVLNHTLYPPGVLPLSEGQGNVIPTDTKLETQPTAPAYQPTAPVYQPTASGYQPTAPSYQPQYYPQSPPASPPYSQQSPPMQPQYYPELQPAPQPAIQKPPPPYYPEIQPAPQPVTQKAPPQYYPEIQPAPQPVTQKAPPQYYPEIQPAPQPVTQKPPPQYYPEPQPPQPVTQKPPPLRPPRPIPTSKPFEKPRPQFSGGNIPFRANQSDNEVCGRSTNVNNVNLLIVRGSKTMPGQWPWLAAIFIVKIEFEFQCAGSLVSNNHVVTAAHCFKLDTGNVPAGTILVSLGRYRLRDWREKGSVNREVVDYKLHPDYNSGAGSADADIAIIVLRDRVEFSATIKPICLWTGDPGLEDVVGKYGYVVGWGQDELGNPYLQEPRMTRVPVVAQEVCLWSNAHFVSFTSNRTFCAGARNGSGPCNGDSGSGLVIHDPRSGRYHIRGIVSLSLLDSNSMSCDQSQYIVYVDVAKHLQWVQQQIA